MLSKLTVRRLTKLADYMDSLPKKARKHFNMGAWFQHEGEHELNIVGVISKDKFFDCGTAACALGWAATMPYFRKLGLKLEGEGDYGCELYFNGDPVQWDRMGWLGLSPEQAAELFGGNVPASTPKQWAKRCRKFIVRERAEQEPQRATT